MVDCIITPYLLGFDGLLLYRDYRNGAKDASSLARVQYVKWHGLRPDEYLTSWARRAGKPACRQDCLHKVCCMPTPKRTVFNRSFWQSLIAVLVGNGIYYSIWRYLPPRGQHQLYRIDWGLAVDFWICVICYFLVRLIP
jgi:hypothetical protein